MELMLRIFGFIGNILDILTTPFFWLLSFRPLLPLQRMRSEHLTQSATQLAAKIRNGDVLCEDVVSAFLFRCRRVNARLNAIVEDRYDEAMNEAHAVDKLIASGTKTPEQIERETPLLGVPLSVKECCKLKGMSYAVGCLLRKGKKADDDGDVVRLLRKAGAIPVGITNQPELCMSPETFNFVTGLTRNPYDQHRTVGGTSGGEAALISSGASVIGVGSDIAGSIRCPAMFTGIFGHKPTSEAVSLKGHYPVAEDTDFDKYLTIGPLVRYADDLPLMLKIMSGNQAPKLQLDKKVDVKSLKVLYIKEFGNDFGLIKVDTEIKEAIQKAVNHLNSIGCEVQKAEFEEFNEAAEISSSVMFSFKGMPDVFNEVDDPKHKPNLVVETLKSTIGLSTFSPTSLVYNIMKKTNCMIPKSKEEHYKRLNENLRTKILDHIGNNGIFILPTYPTAAHYNYMFMTKHFGPVYSTTTTALRLPCTNIPMGLNKQGLPIGLQVAAAPYQDRICLAVAKELETKFGGWVQPPSL